MTDTLFLTDGKDVCMRCRLCLLNRKCGIVNTASWLPFCRPLVRRRHRTGWKVHQENGTICGGSAGTNTRVILYATYHRTRSRYHSHYHLLFEEGTCHRTEERIPVCKYTHILSPQWKKNDLQINIFMPIFKFIPSSSIKTRFLICIQGYCHPLLALLSKFNHEILAPKHV